MIVIIALFAALSTQAVSEFDQKLKIPVKQWKELYTLLEQGPSQRVAPEQVQQITTAMGKINKLATERKDIFWSVEGGFSQVIEVAFLPAGAESANNGSEEKPLAQYNVDSAGLNVGE